MADHFLSKIKVAPEDFVPSGEQTVLDRAEAVRALLADRAGPEVANMFAEPLISRGNDEAPPTVSWYTTMPGDARPLAQLSPGERERAERYLAEHLRPLRALADDPATADLAVGALTVYGQDDVLMVGDKPVIVNWGMMPGAATASQAAQEAHYGATLGRFLPLSGELSTPRAAPEAPVSRAAVAAAATGAVAAPAAPTVRERARLSPIAWVPLLVLLLLAGAVLAWLLLPGTRLFHASDTPPAVTDEATLRAAQAHNESLRARKATLEAALEGAVCRADGQLILPSGLTPEGLTPPAIGVAPERKAQVAPDALIPNTPERVIVPGPEAQETTLLSVIEARTVLVIARSTKSGATGSGFFVGPGLIMTNHHVIEPALGEGGQILVTGGALSAPKLARVLKSSGNLKESGGDYALLQIDDTATPAFSVHLPQSSLKLTNVVAAGYPGDVLAIDASFSRLKSGDLSAVPELTVTDGTINTEQQLGPNTNVLMHSAALSSGNSGGPLIDMCGRVVGVNSFVRQGKMQNRGYALTSGDMMAFLQGTPAAPSTVNDACAPLVVRPQVATQPAPTPATVPAPAKPASE
ncbi:MAG: trypsin-like peptidase domain-containing protein [Sedimentitalea sp.]